MAVQQADSGPQISGVGSIRATGPLLAWRTVDILTIAFLGAAFGIAYWGWGLAYEAPSAPLKAIFPPLSGITAAPWLIAGVVGGLVVRRPGAALMCEVVAALVSMIPGTQWGFTTLISGILQGLGAEIGFAILGYGSYRLGAALLAGALSAPMEAVYEWFVYWVDWSWGFKIAYLVIFTVAGGLIAGGLGWLITRTLAGAGALNAFPPGQEARESRAV
ncbi:MAG TPA: ECF transporter S component [Phycicoccus sp.]|jgi:energy-coupling factor transport system substrate-specific component|nr:ECF transporter S component [Phycicoccus sp.]HQH06211.1 ECF transporter S component [Phycicoccus sp.]HQK30268.1 ECF transporter S component [Phycicoccus sp.]HQV90571.1 ECF transporter S component [Phycicoccus sp.]HQY95643.1 ECF transporter S component [Phycicoccus sp.]